MPVSAVSFAYIQEVRNVFLDSRLRNLELITPIDSFKFGILLPFVESFGQLLGELSELAEKVSDEVRMPYFSKVSSSLLDGFDDMIARVNAEQRRLAPAERQKRGADEAFKLLVRNHASSWQGLFLCSINGFKKIHDLVQEHRASHMKYTMVLLSSTALPEWDKDPTLPVSLGVNSRLYRTLRDHVLTKFKASSFMPLEDHVGQPNDRIKRLLGESPHPSLQKLAVERGGIRTWNKLSDIVSSIAEAHGGDSTYILNAYVWLSLGPVALPTNATSMNFFLQFVIFVVRNPGKYKDYADFLLAATELAGALEECRQYERVLMAAATKAGKQLPWRLDALETMLQTMSEKSPKFPDAMRAYVGFMSTLKRMRDKFGAMSSGGGPRIEAAIVKELMSFVEGSGRSLVADAKQSSRDFHARMTTHLDAIRAARDLCLTYAGLDSSKNTPEWQEAEFVTCAKMIAMASGISVHEASDLWMLRVDGLRTIINVFTHFNIQTAKRNQGNVAATGEKTSLGFFASVRGVDPSKWFGQLERAISQAFRDGQQHGSEGDFHLSLTRLKSFIDFHMSMPEMGEQKALAKFREVMEAHKEMSRGVSDKQLSLLQKAYAAYEHEFRQHEKKYTSVSSGGAPSVKQLLREIGALASDACFRGAVGSWEVGQIRPKIPLLLARVSVLFSLYQTQLIRLDNLTVREVGEISAIRPHIMQVLGLLSLLGLTSLDASSRVANQIAQVLTGQGKSWVLVLLASLFALTGKDVVILCHNEDLTKRDSKASSPFLALLGHADVKLGAIRYQTYFDMCFDMLKAVDPQGKEHDIVTKEGSLIDQVLKDTSRASTLRDLRNKQLANSTVLLIDEVDVLFGSLYGESQNTLQIAVSRREAEVQRKMWSEEKALTAADLEPILRRYADGELVHHPLFVEHLKQMGAGLVQTMKGLNASDHRLRQHRVERRTERADQPGREDWSASTYYGYLNAFYYLKLCPDDPGDGGDGQYGYLRVPSASLSYAEIPTYFTSIFGVTGSLGVLPSQQREVLQSKYKVTSFSYFPSFWGERQLKWDEGDLDSSAFRVVDDEVGVFRAALQMISREVRNGRAVLVFLRDSDALRAFKSLAGGQVSNLLILDSLDNVSREGKEMIIDKQSGEPGAVTFATATYGRGEE